MLDSRIILPVIASVDWVEEQPILAIKGIFLSLVAVCPRCGDAWLRVLGYEFDEKTNTTKTRDCWSTVLSDCPCCIKPLWGCWNLQQGGVEGVVQACIHSNERPSDLQLNEKAALLHIEMTLQGCENQGILS